MTADQYRNVTNRYGLAFTAALAEYLIKLKCHQWAKAQLRKPEDNFYDRKFTEQLLAAHADSEQLWAALARCRDLRGGAGAAHDNGGLSDLRRGLGGGRDGQRDGEVVPQLLVPGGLI